jgi:hypothetical protein
MHGYKYAKRIYTYSCLRFFAEDEVAQSEFPSRFPIALPIWVAIVGATVRVRIACHICVQALDTCPGATHGIAAVDILITFHAFVHALTKAWIVPSSICAISFAAILVLKAWVVEVAILARIHTHVIIPVAHARQAHRGP